MRRRGFVIDACDKINPRETSKPPINFYGPPPPIDCKDCGDREPRPRTKNQRRCNPCVDQRRWAGIAR